MDERFEKRRKRLLEEAKIKPQVYARVLDRPPVKDIPAGRFPDRVPGNVRGGVDMGQLYPALGNPVPVRGDRGGVLVRLQFPGQCRQFLPERRDLLRPGLLVDDEPGHAPPPGVAVLVGYGNETDRGRPGPALLHGKTQGPDDEPRAPLQQNLVSPAEVRQG